jgi:predicted dehydrogenase
MVGHIERFNPAVRALKRRLQSGELGRVYQVHAQRVGPFPFRIRDVGVVFDLAPHDIDVMRYLLDEEVERVYAETERRLNTEHEDMVLGLLRFSSGAVGVLDINWLTPEKVRRLRVLGERGTYELDYIAQTLDFAPRQDDAAAAPRIRLWPETPGAVEEPLRLELSAFVAAVRDSAPSPMSGADAVAALDLAAKLVQSGEEGRAIAVAHPIEV